MIQRLSAEEGPNGALTVVEEVIAAAVAEASAAAAFDSLMGVAFGVVDWWLRLEVVEGSSVD